MWPVVMSLHIRATRKLYCCKRCRRLTNLEIERGRKGAMPSQGSDSWTWEDVIDIWADDLYQRQSDRGMRSKPMPILAELKKQGVSLNGGERN